MTPVGAYLTTVIGTGTCLIWGAGAPAKTKNVVHRKVNIFFRGKVRPFPYLAKEVNSGKSVLAREWELLAKRIKRI